MTFELVFPARKPLAQIPTPLQPLQLTDTPQDKRLWIKRDDLTGAALSGNKIRKLEYVLAQALAEGADTLVTCGGLQSNHCRATALTAAAHGLGCELILRGDKPDNLDGNLLLSAMAGAAYHCYRAPDYHRNLPLLLRQTAERLKTQGKKPFIIPTGASDEIGLWGYIQAAQELAQDFMALGIQQPLVVCAAGSGGTLAGLAAGLGHFCPEAEVLGIAVCDSQAYFEQRVREDIAKAQHVYPQSGLRMPSNYCVNAEFIGPGYAKGYPALYKTIQQLAREVGVILDPVYTGKAFYGIAELMRRGAIAQRDIVFIHTGGIFGVFPEREALQL
ncbi:1-aminocyclopropane-1-carboxylate deaminase/D-cysteine desulfhydrase [Gilvimarinus xylanilyticus]|uniref:D-cysteine desulfhydrase family protein n=1 Tax=Gilvimarinus xylanilyticus TaxID=2944139 RepID=A0A9X2KSW9_9GAMM|nr:D-cysteine desulfhydrase family protein [Gilvimarinus xylanilyticus]